MKQFRLPPTLQKGLTMIEVTIALVVVATLIGGATIAYQQYMRHEYGRNVGLIYQRLNNAAGNYLTNYYPKLLALPTKCSNITWGVDRPPLPDGTAPDDSCKLTLEGVTVVNGMQPTLSEMVTLKLLENGQDTTTLPLATRLVVKDPNDTLVTPTFAFLIERVCIVGTTVNPTPATGCNSGLEDLRSLVFNSQPYTDSSAHNVLDVVSTAALIAGPDAFMADPLSTDNNAHELRAFKNSVWLKNPLRDYSDRDIPEGKGLTNIVAMRNGYASSGSLQYMRRDGSTQPTGNWNFGGFAITNVGKLEADEITVNKLTVKEKFRLAMKKSAGDSCDPNTETVASNIIDGGDLLMCDSATSKWRSLGADGAIKLDHWAEVEFMNCGNGGVGQVWLRVFDGTNATPQQRYGAHCPGGTSWRAGDISTGLKTRDWLPVVHRSDTANKTGDEQPSYSIKDENGYWRVSMVLELQDTNLMVRFYHIGNSTWDASKVQFHW